MIKIILGIALIVALIVAGPLAFLWSLVTLKEVIVGSLSMWTLEAWFAALIFGAVISPTVRVNKS